MSLNFVNDKSYIRVTNTATGVRSFFLKRNLFIQKHGTANFTLRSEGQTGYFKYADVNSPSSSSIDDLIDILISFVDEFTDQDGDSTALTNSKPLNQVRTAYRYSPAKELLERTYVNASSTFDAATGLFDMSTTTDDGTRIVRQTREYVPATFVAQVVVVAAAVLYDGNATDNVTSRVGTFEDNYDISVNSSTAGRGVFFEQDFSSGTVSAVLRSNDGAGTQTDTKVAQASWNIDALNGSGLSGYTLNTTTLTNYVVDFDPVRKLARLGVLEDERVFYAHEFTGVDLLNVPVRWELTQTVPGGGTGTLPSAVATISQGKSSVFHTVNATLYAKSVDGGIDKKVLSDQGASLPLLSVRLSSAANRAKLVIKRLSLLNVSSGGIGRWELVLNPTLTGASFTAVTDSLAEVSTAETAATGGKTLASGFLSDHGLVVSDLTDNELLASSDIDGNPDTITVRVTNVNGVLELLSGLHWYERE